MKKEVLTANRTSNATADRWETGGESGGAVREVCSYGRGKWTGVGKRVIK